RLSAKLKADPPVGLDDLQQPEIGVEVPRSAQKVASRVAECSDRIERELGGVEPLLNHLRVGAVVAQLRAAAAQILPAVRAAREGVIPSAANAKREAALPDHDCIQLPAIQELVRHSSHWRSWHLPDVRELEIVRDVIPAERSFESDIERIGAKGVFECLRPDVVGQDRKSMAESLLDVQ